MAYINTQTNQYPVGEREIRNAYPNVAFATPFQPPVQYKVVFPAPRPDYNPIVEAVREVAPELTSKGVWEQRWQVVKRFDDQAKEDEAIAKQQQRLAKDNVEKAKKLLAETDFSMLSDARAVLANVADFDDYRTAIRAVIINPSATVEWPTKPESVWVTE